MARLKDLDFTDIILSQNSDETYLKGNFQNKIQRLDSEFYPEILQIKKIIEEQNNKNEFLLKYDGIFYRVAKLDTLNGKWFVLRKGVKSIPTLLDLGFPQKITEKLLSEKMKYGLVVFSGSMGSGKTTSASSFVVERLKKFGGHAVTIEDPPELPLQGNHEKGLCFQTEVHNKKFAESLVKTLRYAYPEIIFLGELREPLAVSEALRGAINGHLIVSTFHASGIKETLLRLLALAKQENGDMANSLLAEGLACVIHQNLVKSGDKKKLKINFLFATEEFSLPVRSKIRSGKIHELGTEIQMQVNKLILGL